jgi:hypothetical protein
MLPLCLLLRLHLIILRSTILHTECPDTSTEEDGGTVPSGVKIRDEDINIPR